MKPTILAFVGRSGSGKTTAVEYLKKSLNIPVIVSYTTRPMREGEIEGVDHFFVSERDYNPLMSYLAYADFGGFRYWACSEQATMCGCPVCSYVVDEAGLIDLLRQRDIFNVVPIKINRSEQTLRAHISTERLMRDQTRDDLPSSIYTAIIPNYKTLDHFQHLLHLTILNVL